ncbi:MAG: ComF family protein [Clostridiales bacterium]|nr:ComF family protein [Clostridiales bacterium]
MRLREAFGQTFFPQRTCVCCGALGVEPVLCPACQKKMTELAVCSLCASFTEPGQLFCRFCRAGEKKPFEAAVAAMPYQGLLRKNIHRFKYGGKAWLRRPFADMVCRKVKLAWPEVKFDLAAAVPVHANRLRQRGYDQAELFGELAAAELDTPFAPGLLLRVKDTPPSAGYKKAERRILMRDAFAPGKGQAAGAKILLLDDIYTTGETAKACSECLLKMGAAQVWVATIAATALR